MMISATTGGYSLNAQLVWSTIWQTGEGPVSYDLKRANWKKTCEGRWKHKQKGQNQILAMRKQQDCNKLYKQPASDVFLLEKCKTKITRTGGTETSKI